MSGTMSGTMSGIARWLGKPQYALADGMTLACYFLHGHAFAIA
jgi:hypothetical protein